MEISLKTGFAQIFSCCPKFGGGGAAAPLAPPPGAYAYDSRFPPNSVPGFFWGKDGAFTQAKKRPTANKEVSFEEH